MASFSSESDFVEKSELKSWFLKNILSSKNIFPRKNAFKHWQDQKFFIQNLIRFNFFNWRIWQDERFFFKTWRAVIFLIQILIFYMFFEFSHENGSYKTKTWEFCNLSLQFTGCSLVIYWNFSHSGTDNGYDGLFSASPLHIFEALWVARNGMPRKDKFHTLLICYDNYDNHLEKA